MKLTLQYLLFGLALLTLTSCQNITAADIQRLIELAQSARKTSGK